MKKYGKRATNRGGMGGTTRIVMGCRPEAREGEGTRLREMEKKNSDGPTGQRGRN